MEDEETEERCEDCRLHAGRRCVFLLQDGLRRRVGQ